MEDPVITPTESRADVSERRGSRRAGAEIPPPPRRLRHYEHRGALGVGGMGLVHRYQDTKLQRPVAIKLVRDREDRALILREARAAARIQHPNVVGIYEVDEVEGFIVTEYIAGQRLDTCRLPMRLSVLLPLARDLAGGLAEVHRCGMIHGDIKPANILIEARTQRPKLIDFGLARHHGRAPAARDSSIAGTPPYMAPELWAGHPPTPAADVFAFGVLLHLLGTGVMPAPDDLRAAPGPMDEGVPPDLVALVHDCLAPDPLARPRDGRALVERLARIETGAGGEGDRAREGAGDVNPYLGIRPFDHEHRGLFFGRSSEIEEVVARLRQPRMVVITGESGVGKSSLARAGVLPRLRDRAWSEARVAPNPLGALAGLMASALAHRAPAAELEILIRNADWPGLERCWQASRPAGAMVWFFDQLDDLLATEAHRDAERFARALAWVLDHCPDIHVLATARSDVFVRLAYLPALGPKIEQGTYLLRPLERAALAEVITEPARRVGLGFEPETLVAELVAATEGVHGGLPLLQATMVELWMGRDRRRNVITRGSYEAIGGIAGAVTRYADRVYQALVPDKRPLARRLLLRLVDSDSIRARRKLWRPCDLPPAERDLLDRLVADRLVVVREIEGAPGYELAHDCLVSRWGQLRQWLHEEGDRQVMRQRLERDALEWQREQRSPDFLWNNRQLSAAHGLAPGDLPATEAAFLAASRGRRRRTRLVRGAALLGILALVMLVYAGVRYQATMRIDRQVAVATAAYDQARRTWSTVRDQHEAMTARLRQNPLDQEAIAAWPGLLAALADVERGLRDANMHCDAILAMAPDRDRVRRMAATLAYERLRLAYFLERQHEALELEDKLRAYGPGHGDGCRAPVAVALDVRPVPAVLRVHRYAPGSDGRLVRTPVGEHALRQSSLALALPPGSYLFTVRADDARAELRYPLWLDCGSSPVTLALARPALDAVPPGFVHVPAGTVRYGFGRNRDQEPFRTWFETTPLHERYVDAYLIARHETTFGQWIEFLDACRGNACAGIVARPPRVSATSPREIPLQLIEAMGQGGWILELRPTPENDADRVYRAAQGQTLIYPGREQRRAQTWERMPVTGVAWDDVQAYLRWLRWSNRVPGARLCRDDEWERAARGADGRLYPHGSVLRPQDANHDRTYGRRALAYGLDEVGSYPASASPFGIDDMAGNAWEMVLPWDSDDESRIVPVLRGGSYYHSVINAVTVNRWVIERSDPDSRVGFRVCAPAPAGT